MTCRPIFKDNAKIKQSMEYIKSELIIRSLYGMGIWYCSNKVFKFKEWLVPIIHGYIGTFKDAMFEYTLISRRSRFSTGARDLKRGLSKHGNWANEVESEHILTLNKSYSWNRTKISSFVQVRASIPLFWRTVVTKISINPKLEYDERKNIGYKSSLLHIKDLQKRYDCEHI